MTDKRRRGKRSLRVAGMFAGIGGLELGLKRSGHEAVLMSEWDPAAQAVLRQRLPGVRLRGDIREIKRLPRIDLLTGGFPCQDLSLAGTRAGLAGERSGLLWEMFRLIDTAGPELVLFENVSNLLRLDRGAHMKGLLEALDMRGYRWAYRLVDSRGFGLPQRRLRVVILASCGDIDPAGVLFSDSVEPEFDDSIGKLESGSVYGFYWTEGKRGVGWARDAVPTIKGGSGLGIPSPPAVYIPHRAFAGKLTIEDAERLQGFRKGWTEVSLDGSRMRPGARWTMVGNAVSVPVSEWIGRRLALGTTKPSDLKLDEFKSPPMPRAACGDEEGWRSVDVSTHVSKGQHAPLGEFLRYDLEPLSQRAISGYLSRVESGQKRLPEKFLADLYAQQSSLAA
jgi:DNA (cytosine-5)-methyltransferase 1